MQTRSKSGIRKKKAFSTSVQSSVDIIEPTTFKAATKVPEWKVAMQEEIDVLHAQNTFTLVPMPLGQEEGIDYNEIFSPVVKPTTVSSSELIDAIITNLTKAFDMKDLGQLHYFLGLEINYLSTGLFVSQTKYIRNLLHKVDLQDSKPCATPYLPYHRLLKFEGAPYHSPEQYRSIVGALQYLTFTRPDIAFSVNQCCQFMHSPMDSDVVAVKRILSPNRVLWKCGTFGFNDSSKHVISRATPVMPPIAVATVGVLCWNAIAQSSSAILTSGKQVVLASALLHSSGFFFGYIISRMLGLDVTSSRTISIENSVLRIVLAGQHFGNPLTAVPCAVSSVCHSILGSALAGFWRQIVRTQKQD
ncbi:sodium/metabolite cotransporter BASS1 [Pyrus ussuriensis x Pyrus communis]|uniref:Sodium/metabolite cotransporter BASS1 n=1 Tax=Pyrus ussuriensis x Pyrus communis TaxID=2448454 RepID=A0A5N5FR15_9ROSA|nr:sodium/metabolite cotransporter BASS1 [Pyrus ussuriensis x Pyrus communis]